MKWLDFYSTLSDSLSCNDKDAVFAFFKENLQPTNHSWDYFVDWEKIESNLDNIADELEALDTLIGQADVKNAILKLTRDCPSIKSVLPILIALRDGKIKVLEDIRKTPFTYRDMDLSAKSSPQEVLDFMENIGVVELLRKGEIKSFRNFVLGVEVGLDSNARKNRGGKIMESIVGKFVSSLCKKHGWRDMSQATNKKVADEFGETFVTKKANKTLDFAIKTRHALFLIETNFYNKGGSKLKSTANEYQKVHSEYGHPFIWITDGQGWTSDNSLKDAFDDLDYIINIHMMQKGLLEAILLQEKP